MKTVNFVTFIWIIGRICHGILYLIREDSINNSNGSELEEIFDRTYTVILIIVDLLVTELLCFIFILDLSFFRIFSSDFIDSPVISKSMLDKHEISMNLCNEDDFTPSEKNSSFLQTEPLSNQKGKLGSLYLTEINNTRVVIRKIALTRVNQYVVENIQSELEKIKQLGVKNLAIYHDFRLAKAQLELIMPYFEEGSLYFNLHVKKTQFTDLQKIIIAQKIAEILNNIHKESKHHGHLTSHNIFLKHNYEVFISDLGLDHLKKFCGLVAGYSNKSS